MIIQDASSDPIRSDAPRPRRAEAARTVATNDPHPGDIPRSDFLKLVQQKMKKGYYNSETVLEDLSQSFAGAFNKIV